MSKEMAAMVPIVDLEISVQQDQENGCFKSLCLSGFDVKVDGIQIALSMNADGYDRLVEGTVLKNEGEAVEENNGKNFGLENCANKCDDFPQEKCNSFAYCPQWGCFLKKLNYDVIEAQHGTPKPGCTSYWRQKGATTSTSTPTPTPTRDPPASTQTQTSTATVLSQSRWRCWCGDINFGSRCDSCDKLKSESQAAIN